MCMSGAQGHCSLQGRAVEATWPMVHGRWQHITNYNKCLSICIGALSKSCPVQLQIVDDDIAPIALHASSTAQPYGTGVTDSQV